MVTLAFAYISFGLPRPGGGDGPVAGVAPAIVAPATPSSDEAVNRLLTAVTLPAGVMPAEIVGSLNLYSVPVGIEGTWDWTCCTGVRLDYILESTYTVRGAGPMQVQRGGCNAAWEEIGAGTEIVLDAGDALLSRMEDAFDGVNSGSTPVELLDVVLFEGTPLDDPIPFQASGARAWLYHDQDIWLLPVPVPNEPITMRLEQARLGAAAERLLPTGAFMQLGITRDDGIVISTREDFSLKSFSEQPASLYALTLEPAGAESGAATPAAAAP